MIVPALALEMERAGLGTINRDLFWEEVPYDSEGIWVVTRGDAGSTDDYQLLQIDISARFNNKVTTEMRLRAITNWVRNEAKNLCLLTVNPHDLDGSQFDEDIQYVIYDISHTGAVQNNGIDAQGRVLKTITIQVKFNERT